MEVVFQWIDRLTQNLIWQAVLTRFQWVDWGVFVLLAFGLIYGIKKGLMSEIGSILELSVVIYLVLEHYAAVGFLLKKYVAKNAGIDTLVLPGFILLALAAAFAAGVVRYCMEKMIHTTTAKPLHILGGGLLGLVYAFILASFMAQAVLLTPFVKVKRAFEPEASLTGVYVARVAPQIHHTIQVTLSALKAKTEKRAVAPA